MTHTHQSSTLVTTDHDVFSSSVRTVSLEASNTSAIGIVSLDMFGAIANNYFGFESFLEDTEELGLGMIRFPGGAVAERGIFDERIRLADDEITIQDLDGDRSAIAFDLTHPELISPLALQNDEQGGGRNNVASFSDVLAAGVDRGADVGLVIPVSRYFNTDDPWNRTHFHICDVRLRALEQARQDISVFLERLRDGEFNDGELPPTIIFELGNEQYDYPIEYAMIAKTMAEEIEAVLSDTDISYEVAIQMPRGNRDFDRLNEEYFDRFLSIGTPTAEGLENLSELLGHDGSREAKALVLSSLMIEIFGASLQHIDALRHHNLGFTSDGFENWYNQMHHYDEILSYWLEGIEEHGGNRDEVDYYMSAWTTNSTDAGAGAMHLAGAVNTLQLFAHFVQQGVDRAAVWGIVGDFILDSDTRGTVLSDVRSDILTPQAAILGLMANNIAGSELLNIGLELEFDDFRTNDYRMYVYEGEYSYSVFLAVEGLGGNPLNVRIGPEQIEFGGYAIVTNLGTDNGAAGAAVMDQRLVFLGSGGIEVTFDQDYEIVMISAPKEGGSGQQSPNLDFGLLEVADFSGSSLVHVEGSSGDDDIVSTGSATAFWGGEGDDTFFGTTTTQGQLSDLLDMATVGQAGTTSDDIVFGGSGDDQLQGNRGNDWLSGGAGNDELWGGSGADTFVFTQGSDTIHDFNPITDNVIIDSGLLPEGPEFFDWLLRATTVENGSTIVRFDNDSSLEFLDEFTFEEIWDRFELG